MEYLSYILAAWMISFIILITLISWILIDYHSLTKTLTELETRGIRRRSNDEHGELHES